MVYRRQIRLTILLHLSNIILYVSIAYALTDAEILLKFKSSLADQTALKSWDTNRDPPCTGDKENWVGLICADDNIWGLQLENMGLSGKIDTETLTELPELRTLSIQNNDFEGPIPDFKRLTGLRAIYLSNNKFSGEIPGEEFAGMIALRKLILSKNEFTGKIPESVASLPKLVELKLDGNKFSGKIPDFKDAEVLETMDVSNNELEGPIPDSLKKMRPAMFEGNKGLCGGPLQPCASSSSSSSSSPAEETTDNSEEKTSLWVIVVLIVVGVIIILAILAFIIANERKKQKQAPKVVASQVVTVKADQDHSVRSVKIGAKSPDSSTTKLSFLRDDTERFDLPDLLQANAEILGSGCFGSSYKAALPSGTVMVVKRYKQLNHAGKEEFQEHMRRLGRLQHSHVLPLVAYYYRKEEKLVVCKFVPNGSLAFHLHGHKSAGKPSLDGPTRLKIAKGIAKGLGYLNRELPSLVAPHGHLKSSNILLDESYEPLLTDYGLIPVVNQGSAQLMMASYKSPEYEKHGKITKKSDAWCLGQLILEILTGRFPKNLAQKGKGNDEEDIATWVRSVIGDTEDMLSSSKMEVFDKKMGPVGNIDAKIMVQLLKIGLSCCEADVTKRLDLKDAVAKIEELTRNHSIDGEFFSVVDSDDSEDEKK